MTSTSSEVSNRIVVGVDGSDSSLAALEWAARQAELTGATLELLTAWAWPTTYGAPLGFPPGFDPVADAKKVLETAAAKVLAAHPGLEIHITVAEGHPSPALVKASQGASLLVVGSRGHGEFAGMLLGSVGEHCATNAHCPVLVLRGDG
jgi:nucleotide-binding universal stress UspA family protein